jgi:peptidoglycan/LPS O-acetylase OafA/YrhL
MKWSLEQRASQPPSALAQERQGDPSHAVFVAQRRFASLNGLRCLAILEVIWHHATWHRDGPWTMGVGVDLSFAISGFLITTLLIREFSKTGKIDVRRFYLRRTLRIFPLYFTVLGIYVLLVLIARSGTPEATAFVHRLPAYATYTQNWFVPIPKDQILFFTWSLATQEQFYLLWAPALLLCLAPGRWWRASAFAVGLIVVDRIATDAVSGNALPVTILRSIAMPICLGALWSLLLHSPAGFAAGRRALGHRAIAPTLIAITLASFAMREPHEIIEFLLAALVAACCIREDTLAAPVLTARPLRFVGEISYGMYLLHMLAVNAVRHVVGRRVGVSVFLPATGLTIALSYASYRWFETPILRYRDRVQRSEPQAVAASVVGSAPWRRVPTQRAASGMTRPPREEVDAA